MAEMMGSKRIDCTIKNLLQCQFETIFNVSLNTCQSFNQGDCSLAAIAGAKLYKTSHYLDTVVQYFGGAYGFYSHN